MQADIAVTCTVTAAADLSILRDSHGPWTDRWRDVLHCLEQLKVAYSPGGETLGWEEVQHRVQVFFLHCYHIRDSLRRDLSTVPGITTSVDAYISVKGSPLSTCRDVCNTYKHDGRDPGKTEAGVYEINLLSSNGARATIKTDMSSPSAPTVDALDLAKDCVQAWRDFLKGFGITAP
ncbi:MAG: hypothetical protein ACLP36_13025 [Acidimicrobiales bacterium]